MNVDFFDVSNHPHPLSLSSSRIPWGCDGLVCKQISGPTDRAVRHRCSQGCDFDLCRACIAYYAPSSPSLSLPVPIDLSLFPDPDPSFPAPSSSSSSPALSAAALNASPVCTFSLTGDAFHPQDLFVCLSCSPSSLSLIHISEPTRRS